MKIENKTVQTATLTQQDLKDAIVQFLERRKYATKSEDVRMSHTWEDGKMVYLATAPVSVIPEKMKHDDMLFFDYKSSILRNY